jgi:hypothetical protein
MKMRIPFLAAALTTLVAVETAEAQAPGTPFYGATPGMTNQPRGLMNTPPGFTNNSPYGKPAPGFTNRPGGTNVWPYGNPRLPGPTNHPWPYNTQTGPGVTNRPNTFPPG